MSMKAIRVWRNPCGLARYITWRLHATSMEGCIFFAQLFKNSRINRLAHLTTHQHITYSNAMTERSAQQPCRKLVMSKPSRNARLKWVHVEVRVCLGTSRVGVGVKELLQNRGHALLFIIIWKLREGEAEAPMGDWWSEHAHEKLVRSPQGVQLIGDKWKEGE